MAPGNRKAIVLGGAGALLLWIVFGRKKPAAQAPAPQPGPGPGPGPAQASFRGTQNPAGISWGGVTYPDVGSWRAHVRPIYGPILVMNAGESVAALRAALAGEYETTARLHALNSAYKAFTSPEALAVIDASATPQAMLA